MRQAALILLVWVGICWSKPQTVVIEAFDWNSLSDRGTLYTQIQGNASAMASAGITHVWFPPPSQSADQEGYLPGEWYNILYPSQLRSALSAIWGKGMYPLMDTVLNHRTATYKSSCNNNWINFTDPNWESTWVVVDDYGCNNTPAFCNGGCSCGAKDTGENECAAPDTDHTNTGIQNDIIQWMNFMKSNWTFSGWRFDMAIGYGGEYVGKYVTATTPVFAVGEYWTDDEDQIVAWIQATGYKSTAFDFPGRDNLKACVDADDYTDMIWGTNPPGLMGVEPNYASTFTDNHDTARNDRFGNTEQIIQGYAYILSHPGYPFVFWDDWANPTSRSAIIEFISIRNQYNLNPTQKIYIAQHAQTVYAAFLGGAASACSGAVAMKIGSGSWDPQDQCSNNWTLITSGTNYAFWKSA